MALMAVKRQTRAVKKEAIRKMSVAVPNLFVPLKSETVSDKEISYANWSVKDIKVECTRRKLNKTTGKNRNERVEMLIDDDKKSAGKKLFIEAVWLTLLRRSIKSIPNPRRPVRRR